MIEEGCVLTEQKENHFFIDSKKLSAKALEKKHRLENDPSCRKDLMEYFPDMEHIQSDVRDRVMAAMHAYEPDAYTAIDVRRALDHERVTIEDFEALLSPAANSAHAYVSLEGAHGVPVR